MAELAVEHRKDPATLGRFAVALVAFSVSCFLIDALLGPSVASPALPGAGPLRDLGLNPKPELASGLLWAAVALGGSGVLVGWIALVKGWVPSPRRVRNYGIAAAALMAAVPPLGSCDIMNYAAYGRLAALGLSPYTNTVQDLLARHDAVGQAYVGPWDEVSSVYGPVATGAQTLISMLSGDSVKMFALTSQILAFGVFVGIVFLLERVAGADTLGRRRVAVLFAANPLVLFLIVNSAHLDGLAVLFGLAALVTLRRSPAAAGVLLGLAFGIKVTLVLYGLGMVWALRGSPRDLLKFSSAAAGTGLLVYLPFLPEALQPLQDASQYIARQSVWHLVQDPLEWLMHKNAVDLVFTVGSWLLVAVVTWRLSPVLPRRPGPRDYMSEAIWASALVSLAWLLSSMYALAWYDVIAWVPLALLPLSRIDLLLLTRTTVIALASVPGLLLVKTGVVGSAAGVLIEWVAPVMGLALLGIVLFAGDRLRQPPGVETPRFTSAR